MIKIINDIPLIEEIFEYDIVLFTMGVNNSMSNGFNYDIAINFPEVLESESKYQYGDLRKYGTIHETESENIKFVACYSKKTSLKKNKKDLFLDYEYLEKCLQKVSEKYINKKIGCKVLGCDEYDGNADEEKVIQLFEKYFGNSGDVTLYRYKQMNFSDEIYKKIKHAHYRYKHKLLDVNDYLEIRRILEWRKKHGIFSEIPNDFVFLPKKKMKRKIIHNKNGVLISF